MPSVRLDSEFFRKERDQVYSDWKLAFWRELFQNSIDQDAGRIDVAIKSHHSATRITFKDDGPGMTRDVLENVYFALGATTKTGTNQIGGMGRARILTCFAQDAYVIRSYEYRVTGKGGDYEVKDVKNHFDGCLLEIDVPAQVEQMTVKLKEFLSESDIEAKIFLNDEYLRPSALHRGRHIRNLICNQSEFAEVYVNKSATRHRLIVRVNGVSMFTQDISASAQVIVELDPEKSRSILTANRDGLHYDYNRSLMNFLSELAIDTTSALRDRFSRRTTKYVGKGMRTIRRKNPAGSQKRKSTSNETISNINTMLDINRNMFSNLVEQESETSYQSSYQSVTDSFGDWLDETFGSIYIYDETDNAKIRFSMPKYLPENWQLFTNYTNGVVSRRGGNAIRVLLMWQTAVDYALEVGLKNLVDDGMIKCAVGFVFPGETTTMADHRNADNGHVFSLCPVDENGKLIYKVHNRTSLKRLMTLAKHEVVHVRHKYHDENFSKTREAIDREFDEAECFRRFKTALNNLPDFGEDKMKEAA